MTRLTGTNLSCSANDNLARQLQSKAAISKRHVEHNGVRARSRLETETTSGGSGGCNLGASSKQVRCCASRHAASTRRGRCRAFCAAASSQAELANRSRAPLSSGANLFERPNKLVDRKRRKTNLLIFLSASILTLSALCSQIECKFVDIPTNKLELGDEKQFPANEVEKNSAQLSPPATTLSDEKHTTATAAAELEPTKATVEPTSVAEKNSAVEEKGDEAALGEEDDTGAGAYDGDASGCEGLSATETAEGKGLSDNARLVNLQTCIQGKIKTRLLSATRSGLELFEKLSLTGGCSASLMKLSSSLGEIKSFAFKFLDASAKVPSGVMYGLLSDFGDFDQCVSIRSAPSVEFDAEAEEGAYSGKYCLLSVKLKYRVRLEPNKTVPDGIIPDGVLWDELIRHYWTANSTKGFQLGVCVPSRCTNDDIDQIYRHVASDYNIDGELLGCQDRGDLQKQTSADTLQRVVIRLFYVIFFLNFLGTLLDRYKLAQIVSRVEAKESSCQEDCRLSCLRCRALLGTVLQVLICFSIRRNWLIFTNKVGGQTTNSRNNWSDLNLNRQAIERANENSSRHTWATNRTESTSFTRSDTTSSFDCYETSSRQLEEQTGGNKQFEQLATTTTSTTTKPSNQTRLGCCDNNNKFSRQLTIDVRSDCDGQSPERSPELSPPTSGCDENSPLGHLSGLKLIVIVWITIGHSFLYPSANNYLYYRSIINMNITRDSIWFATTNFTLGIDMLLYMAGLVFVYKLTSRARFSSVHLIDANEKPYKQSVGQLNSFAIVRLILEKILRFWPTYVTLIGLAIVVPLFSDGPMWPEMVSRRIGLACRENWWTNLLMVNNFVNETQVCLPSSWFVSVLMQLFLIGSLVAITIRSLSFGLSFVIIGTLILFASAISFVSAYLGNLRAPAIRMDESFVMELDDKIFRLYTNVFNNLGPFLIGMVGGLVLVNHEIDNKQMLSPRSRQLPSNLSSGTKSICSQVQALAGYCFQLFIALLVGSIALAVLSSVFYRDYTPFWAAFYWAFHRVGWAIVTGYVIHQSATGRWKLLYDLLSLSTFIPLSRLILVAYLVHPILIHVHSGLVRDGLHVSVYNMMNIYITRLVATFTIALFAHLLVELPFNSMEQMFLKNWLDKLTKTTKVDTIIEREKESRKLDPLLSVAPPEIAIANWQQLAAKSCKSKTMSVGSKDLLDSVDEKIEPKEEIETGTRRN